LREAKGHRAPRRCNAQRTATSPDDALIETLFEAQETSTGYYERERPVLYGRSTKQLTNGKAVEGCQAGMDGRKLVGYYEKQDLKSATIQKKIGWLTARRSIWRSMRRKLKFNPFRQQSCRNATDKQRRTCR